ncbi:MAG: phosphate signaling complex protein PhoU [Pseudomonadota bacterium]
MLGNRLILDVKKQQIEANLASLFAQVKQAIGGAMNCLLGASALDCQALINADAGVNEKRRLIEQDCLVAIASQQPVAHDLRDLVADMRVAGELERMGDYARDIARDSLSLMGLAKDDRGLADIQDMARLCTDMLDQVAQSHRNGDATLARRVAARNTELHASRKALVDSTLTRMRENPDLVDSGTHILWITHSLERYGDRVTNIAEQVVFRVEGETAELG